MGVAEGSAKEIAWFARVVTGAKTIEECRTMLQDALQEMIMAYQQQISPRLTIKLAPLSRQ